MINNALLFSRVPRRVALRRKPALTPSTQRLSKPSGLSHFVLTSTDGFGFHLTVTVPSRLPFVELKQASNLNSLRSKMNARAISRHISASGVEDEMVRVMVDKRRKHNSIRPAPSLREPGIIR